jgi:hypothetical protein
LREVARGGLDHPLLVVQDHIAFRMNDHSSTILPARLPACQWKITEEGFPLS